MKSQYLIIPFAMAACIALPLMSRAQKPAQEVKRPMFLPKPLDDDWSKWIVGQWEGVGESTAGKGKGRTKIELGFNGQFLIISGEAEITEVNPDYLKKNMHATEEEIEQFRRSTYKCLQLNTVDPKTGEIVGYLFDSLRCIATGRGKRVANKETMEWQWTGQGAGTSTRITEKVDNDRLIMTEKYTLPNGAVMEDRGEMIRRKKPAGTTEPQK